MNWLRLSTKISGLLSVLALSACGVKGDPLPPERPSDLGRGRPTYKRATEGIKVEHRRPVEEEDEDKEERDEERD